MEQAGQPGGRPLGEPEAVGAPSAEHDGASATAQDDAATGPAGAERPEGALAPAQGAVDVEEPDGAFSAVRARLEEIAAAVSAEDISLDDALDLYEEAVKLGAQATDLLEGETT